MGDYLVGLVDQPDVKLCTAVAASSAFPPVLSPMTLPITQKVRAVDGTELNRPPYTTQAVLSDGGVYDNLGLETVKRFTTLLVSDAGQKIAPEEDPHHDWARHSLRILDTIDNQVRSLRKRNLIGSYVRGDHSGTYWGIRTDFASYGLARSPAVQDQKSRTARRYPDALGENAAGRSESPHELGIRHLRCGAARPY